MTGALPTRHLRDRLKADERILSSFLTLRDPASAALMTAAGFDCLVIDLEHTRHHPESLEKMITAVHQAGGGCVVRLPGLYREWINWALDSGADGLLLPMLEEEKYLQKFIELCLYPPQGKRGYSGLSPATGYGKTKTENYWQKANDRLLLCVQIETARALENLAGLLNQDRIDLYFLGTGDLSVDLGTPGQYESPAFLQAIDTFFSCLQSRGSIARSGMYGSTKSRLKEGQNRGARFLVHGSDSLFLLNQARQERQAHSVESAG
ncbi:MAG: hypothetical protein HS115_10805 [Spirochaetales bacterium]|nr:hypothetical protein [Spirochaetales bacterium]